MTEKKLTEAEIMKAMEDQKHLFLANDVFVRDALDLINRKNAEIERLQKKDGAECPVCHGVGRIGTTDWLTKNMSAKQLAEKKAKAIAECNAEARAEAIKEFAERVKYEGRQDGAFGYVDLYAIEKIAKEMGVEL